MSDRIVRDELLTSERYWSVSIEAQRLFVHLLLNIDNLARFSGKNYTIRSACFPGQAVDPDKVEKLLSELQDADLVRFYSVDGARFVFVPRFKQRLRYTRSDYPAPPNEINDIVIDKPDLSRSSVRPQPDHSQTVAAEVKRSDVKRSDVMGGESTRARKASTRKAKTPLPPDFAISERVARWAEERDYGQLDAYLEFFVSKAKARGYTYADWDEALMGCIREDWPELRKTGAAPINGATLAPKCDGCGVRDHARTNYAGKMLCSRCWSNAHATH